MFRSTNKRKAIYCHGCRHGQEQLRLFYTLSVLGLWLSVANAHAQLTRGVLSGVVLDPSGARIVGATVALVDTQTGLRRQTRTNGIGIFRLAAIDPGTYSASFSAPGFNARQVSSVRIQSGSETILNQTLAIQDESIAVEVLGDRDVTLMLGGSAGGSNYLGMDAIDGMPFANVLRDAQTFAVFIPHSSRGPAFSGISSGGQRTRSQNYLLDGTDNNELSITGSVLRMIPEELSELQVQYPALSAEFGQSIGSQISLITRSGTNQLHASVWDYYRSSKLDAMGLTDVRAGFNSVPRFVNNQLGGSVGGPIRRDRAFFYVVLEANRRREAPSTRNASSVTIPTQTGYVSLRTIPLGPGQADSTRTRSLQSLNFLPSVYQALPRPGVLSTRPVNGVPIEFQTVRVPLAAPSNLLHGMLRLDHSLGSAGTLNYRVIADKRYQYNTSSNLQFADRFAADNDILHQSHNAALSYAFGFNWMSETRFSFVRSNLAFPENDPESPTVQILGAFTFGGLSTFPQGRIANIFQYQSVISRSSGRHLLRFGADVRRNRLYNQSQFDFKGTWTFNNFTDYLNSQPSRLRHLLTDSSFDARQTSQAYFLQDSIRLGSAVSLDVGLRYELNGAPFGFFGTLDPLLRQVDVPAPVRRDANNFAPRVGLAFAPQGSSPLGRRLLGAGETIIRAGFSLQYDVVFLNMLSATAGNYPRALKYDVVPPDTTGLFPELLPRPTVLPAFDPLRFPFANMDPGLQNPTSHQWLFTIQRNVGPRQSVELGYVGNRTYHLLRQTEANPGILSREQAAAAIAGQGIAGLQERRLNPGWASRIRAESAAISKYHSMFIRHRLELAEGLRADVSLTWSGAFADSDEVLGVGEITSSSPQVSQSVFNFRNEWSRSVFDRPLRLSTMYTYNLTPLADALTSHSLGRALLSGWKTSGTFEWQSGQPFTVVTGVDSGGSGVNGGWRPNLLLSGVLLKDPSSDDLRTFRANGVFETFRTAGGSPLANSMPQGGNLGRNTLRGPSYMLWNANISRQISITERIKLQLRGDFINILNHRNFGNPVANMNNAAFGDNTSDPGGRSVIASAKILF